MPLSKLTKQWVAGKLPKRPRDANKGTFGKVLVIAGSENFPGAAYLSCAASYRVGAGLVTLAIIPSVQTIISRKLPEVTFISRDEIFGKILNYDVLLVGPGLGQEEQAIKLVKKLLKENLPRMVIDADGLNILSGFENWWENLKTDCVLTPHPGEMSRLTGLSIDEIKADRENITQKLARKWGKTVLLKGANTVIASPNGQVAASPFANPLLATAGTGDILSGIIAGFIAQGLNNFDAACCGVYLHGMAGEMMKEKIGDAGLLASDLLPILPGTINSLKRGIK
ncbi:MAG: ADP-dependent (S)-NAD(P)H-hydrate dehydratase [Microgenomates group bacterium Gr01-1014_7]|nr:MAG: ADP-dependent (S)-NAD(P)H-hydrate dehydratase [Microgenomates group bacterium Gr01-1014_7]